MISTILLILHLIGAAFIFVCIIQTIKESFTNKVSIFKALASRIALGLGYQLVTGSFMALASPQTVSLLGFCSRVGLYIGLVTIVELYLYYKISKLSNSFPLTTVSSAVTFGLVAVVFTIFKL